VGCLVSILEEETTPLIEESPESPTTDITTPADEFFKLIGEEEL